MAIEKNFSMVRGSAKILSFAIIDCDGLPMDITGWTFKMQWRKPSGGTLQLTKTNFAVTDALGGTGYVQMFKADTSALAVGTYWYDIWRTDVAMEDALTRGKIDLQQEQTT